MGIEPHEELDELLNGEAEPDLNGEIPEEPEPKNPEEEKGVEAEAKGTEGEEPEEPEAKEGEPPSSEPKADQGVYEGMRAERAKRMRKSTNPEHLLTVMYSLTPTTVLSTWCWITDLLPKKQA